MQQCLSMARLAQLNQEIIEAAIEGLEARKKRIDEQITELRSIAGGGSSRGTTGEAGPKRPARRGRISPEGRAAIAEAQRRRWAAKNAGTAAAATAATKRTRRKMSAAGRRAIAEAQ